MNGRKPHFCAYGYYGYRFNPITHLYEIVPEEAIVIQLIALMITSGYKHSDIVATLNLLHVKRGDDDNRPIDWLWIKRRFGFYNRKNSENRVTFYDKYNGLNGFPKILENDVYVIVDYLMKSNENRKKYYKVATSLAKPTEKKGKSGYTVVVKNVPKSIPINKMIKLASKQKNNLKAEKSPRIGIDADNREDTKR